MFPDKVDKSAGFKELFFLKKLHFHAMDTIFRSHSIRMEMEAFDMKVAAMAFDMKVAAMAFDMKGCCDGDCICKRAGNGYS